MDSLLSDKRTYSNDSKPSKVTCISLVNSFLATWILLSLRSLGSVSVPFILVWWASNMVRFARSPSPDRSILSRGFSPIRNSFKASKGEILGIDVSKLLHSDNVSSCTRSLKVPGWNADMLFWYKSLTHSYLLDRWPLPSRYYFLIDLKVFHSWECWSPGFMMTSTNGNIFRVTGHLYGEFTGPRWIPHTKASDAELWCFIWSAPE